MCGVMRKCQGEWIRVGEGERAEEEPAQTETRQTSALGLSLLLAFLPSPL